jgi:glycosyltransferase involved in cell wall biosynthesis
VKIGFDAKRLFLNKTGLGNYSRTLVRNLQRYFPENKYFLFTPRVEKNEETQYFIDNPDFTVITYPSFMSAYWRSVGVIQYLRDLKIDVFHGLSHELPFGLKKAGIKSCVTVHDLIFEKHPELFPLIDRTLYHFKYKNSAQRADRVLSISHSTTADIKGIWGIPDSKISLLYQTCGDSFFTRPAISERRDYFLYVGAIIPRKGLHEIVEAYDFLEDKYRLPIIVIGTGGTYFDVIRNKIDQQGLSPYFIFKGQVSNTDLVAYYDEARALIYPSKYEGFGIPIVEAALRRCPIICSQTSSMPEASGPDAIFTQPGNSQSIVEAIKFCVDNPDKLENKAKKTYIYADENFNPQHTARSLISIYRDLKK